MEEVRTVDEILVDALALPPEQRADLLRRLADSMPADELEPGLVDELEALADRIDSGAEETRAWSEVRSEIFGKTKR